MISICFLENYRFIKANFQDNNSKIEKNGSLNSSSNNKHWRSKDNYQRVENSEPE